MADQSLAQQIAAIDPSVIQQYGAGALGGYIPGAGAGSSAQQIVNATKAPSFNTPHYFNYGAGSAIAPQQGSGMPGQGIPVPGMHQRQGQRPMQGQAIGDNFGMGRQWRGDGQQMQPPQIGARPTLGGASQGAGPGMQQLMQLLGGGMGGGGGMGAGAGMQQLLPMLMMMFASGPQGLQGLMGGGGGGGGGPMQQGPAPFRGVGSPGMATPQGY